MKLGIPVSSQLVVHSQWLGVFIIFFLAPVLLVGYVLHHSWNFQEREWQETVFHQMDRFLLQIRSKSNTERFLADLIRKTCTEIDNQSNFRFAVPRLKIALNRRFPATFSFIITDHQGNLIPEISDGRPSRYVVSKLVSLLLIGSQRPEDENIRSAWNVVQSLVGPKAEFQQFSKSRTQFMDVSYYDEKRWFFAFLGKKFSLFLHADNSKAWPYLAVQDRARRADLRMRAMGFRAGFSHELSFPKEFEEFGLALAKFQHSLQPHIPLKSKLFCFQAWQARSCLWAFIPKNSLRSFQTHRRYGQLFGVLVLLLSGFLSYRIMVLGRSWRFPIGRRLVALFCLTGGLPLAIITFTAWRYLAQVYQDQCKALIERNVQILRAFDSEFPSIFSKLSREINGVVRKSTFVNGPGRKKLISFLTSTWRKFGRPEIIVVDVKGEIVWATPESSRKNRGLRSNMKSVGKMALASLRGQPFPAFFAGFPDGRENFGAGLLLNLGAIGEFKFMGTTVFEGIFPVGGRQTIPDYMVLISFPGKTIHELYIRDALPKYAIRYPHIEFSAQPQNDLSEAANSGGVLQSMLQPAFLQANLTGEITRSIIPLRNEASLVSVLVPNRLGNFLLGAVQSDINIRNRIAVGSRILGGFVLFFVILATVLTNSLKDRFLDPIRDLGKGVQDIENRNFSTRLPLRGKDELGAVAGLMNSVLEGLRDLEVARLVQANLFPKMETRAGDFRLFGTTKPMTQLGGDYFDLHELNDGRLLVLMGDVAGHGVAAGLVMAMAKALVVGCINRAKARQERLTPKMVLATLQATIFDEIRLESMFTCLVGFLDPISGTWDSANAGHCFSCLFQAGKQPRLLSLPPSIPLTPRRKFDYSKLEHIFQPGDRLFLYTDGFIESKMLDGKQIGFDRAFVGIADLVGDDPIASVQAITRRHEEWTGQEPQSDDITIFLVCRQQEK